MRCFARRSRKLSGNARRSASESVPRAMLGRPRRSSARKRATTVSDGRRPGGIAAELAATLDARTLFVNALPGSEESAQIDRLGQSLPRHCSLNLGSDNRLFDDVFDEATLESK